MSLNPQCQVNNGAVPAVVGAGASVEIELLTPAGADFWGIVAIGTDELSSVAAVNASLVVNQITKKATFTAPAGLGSAVVFQSTVGVANSGSSQGAGIDANGVTQPSFTTTFKINVPTLNGLHVIAVNEVVEENGSFGWIAEQNACIRAASGASGTMTYMAAATNVTVAQSGTVFLVDTSAGAFESLLPTPAAIAAANNGGDNLWWEFVDLPTAASGGLPLGLSGWANNTFTLGGNGTNIVDPNYVGQDGRNSGTVALTTSRGRFRFTYSAKAGLFLP